MNHLKDRLEPFVGGLEPLPQLRLPARPKLAKARAALAETFGRVADIPPQAQLSEVAERLAAAAKAGSWSEVSNKDWRKASWCLWLEKHLLVDNQRFFTEYMRRLKDKHRRNQYLMLIGIYFREFRPKDRHFQQIAKAIAYAVNDWSWVWKERHARYRLFESGKVCEVLASHILEAPKRSDALLESVGFTGQLKACALERAVFEAVLLRVRGQLTNGQLSLSELAAILDWAADDAGLRFAGTEGKLAESLLAPWRDKNPDPKIQETIQEFFLEKLGDPRIRGGKGRWIGVEDADRQVILRWLVSSSLEQFLQIVDRVAQPSHWDYRRKFWTAYLSAGAIDEAWVVFGKSGTAFAKRSFKNRTGYAALSGGQRDHAVLLLRISGLVVADWSHNGTCRIWTPSNRSAPKLYLSNYTRDDLVYGENFDQRHHGSENGRWQDSVATYIRRRTGISVTRKQYMPR